MELYRIIDSARYRVDDNEVTFGRQRNGQEANPVWDFEIREVTIQLNSELAEI